MSGARDWTIDIVDEISLFAGQEQQWLETYRVLQGAEIWAQLGPWISSAKPAPAR